MDRSDFWDLIGVATLLAVLATIAMLASGVFASTRSYYVYPNKSYCDNSYNFLVKEDRKLGPDREVAVFATQEEAYEFATFMYFKNSSK